MASGILAAILSLILPGLGQLYGGQGAMKSIIFIIIAVIFYAIGASTGSFLWLLAVIFNIYAAYDAYVNAPD
ncbi:hypothetical protein ALNOE001_05480 [Candidatus Methanobinarius endosymbioticus]|uniref:TM2 domain-containing protein n=1 Tax=Candidatus Methanobinarius endosymbioticus TaxID=2006182 RepID=A0A366ME92_9EURY|nr:hypothetical protein ALNOE001_05480 [Candidatus Methanobinarius endosymbioticus]